MGESCIASSSSPKPDEERWVSFTTSCASSYYSTSRPSSEEESKPKRTPPLDADRQPSKPVRPKAAAKASPASSAAQPSKPYTIDTGCRPFALATAGTSSMGAPVPHGAVEDAPDGHVVEKSNGHTAHIGSAAAAGDLIGPRVHCAVLPSSATQSHQLVWWRRSPVAAQSEADRDLFSQARVVPFVRPPCSENWAPELPLYGHSCTSRHLHSIDLLGNVHHSNPHCGTTATRT